MTPVAVVGGAASAREPTRREHWTVEDCEVVDYGSADLEPARVVKNARGKIVAVLLEDGKVARAPYDYIYCTAYDPPRKSFLQWLICLLPRIRE